MNRDPHHWPAATNGFGAAPAQGGSVPVRGEVLGDVVNWQTRPAASASSNGDSEHGTPGLGPKVAVYSHDAQGLGHVRRNLLISRALCSTFEDCSVLVMSGLREAASYGFPPGVDGLTLPSLAKSEDGTYFARSLGMSLSDLIAIRRDAITAAVQAMGPDLLIVDKLPTGIFDELLPALDWLRAHSHARVVLGLRDILDDADSVHREWADRNYVAAIRGYFDQIWVYGDRSIFDVTREYGLPEDVASMIRYTGYLNPRHAPETPGESTSHDLNQSLGLPRGSLTLCLIGGGRDGLPLARAFLGSQLPADGGGVVVSGPLMDPESRAELRTLAAGRQDVRVLEFVTDPMPLLCCADQVIAMGGYNTICETLAHHKRLLVVPRVKPRLEQLIRATRFAEHGLLDVLHPNELSASALSRWIQETPRVVPAAQTRLDFNGMRRIPSMMEECLPDLDREWAVGVRND